jgi:hypothetical protein
MFTTKDQSFQRVSRFKAPKQEPETFLKKLQGSRIFNGQQAAPHLIAEEDAVRFVSFGVIYA